MTSPRNENAVPGGEPDTARGQSNEPDHCTPGLQFVDQPFFEGAEWCSVFVDQNRKHWCRLTDGRLLPVSRDAAGNWVTTRGEVLIFTPEGAIFRPALDPIETPDMDHEALILELAARRLRAGHSLDLADDARVELARRRLESSRTEAARILRSAAS